METMDSKIAAETSDERSQHGLVSLQNTNISRACHSCHVSKVRCNQPIPGMPCLRCQKASKPCFPADKPQKNRQQLNDRILDIQSKIDKMISSAVKQEATDDRTRSSAESFPAWPADLTSVSNISGQHGWAPSVGAALPMPSSVSSGAVDLKTSIQSVLDKAITPYLDHATAETMLSRYITNMAPTFPAVVFPPGTTAADVRKDNPILLLAILDVASSGFCELEIQRRLRKLVVQTTSMSLRAPNVMRWTHCMDECLEILGTSPDAFPSDKVLCQHIRALQLSYYFSSLYLNEVAFCTASENTTSNAEAPSKDQTSATITIPADIFSECVETIDHIFRVFTSLDMSAIRVLPAVHLIRMIYTALILVKLHFAAITSTNEDAQPQIDRLQVSRRLGCIIQMFAGWGPLWPATKLMAVFRRIRSWFEDDDMMKRDGSWLNVWRLGPPSLSPEDTQSSTDLLGPNDGSFLSPGSQDPSWMVSADPNILDTIPLSFNPPLELSSSGFTPTSGECMISNMIDTRDIDATLNMDLELEQLPTMSFDSNNPQPPLSHDTNGTFYDSRAEDRRRNN
ncbi:hypothetical protein BDV33DRAFT_229871 [Aspergillus novoparasiticus]|uniref:Zn(2)-C6 fungal-type domain-containing protein n=1 Tax=Aspergillus novoparasiticus TaxID=986946 RepID=A0A5N6EZH4_9EURO|nr:hypothetical protein BDV33DRAFT_229871 [Aspergillus novoparasiticus]